MVFRRYPLSLYAGALIIFGLTAILPVGYMVWQLVIGLIGQQASVTSAIVDGRQLVLLGRSIVIALSATLVAVAIGLPVAIILAAKDLPFKKFFYFLVFIPALIPSYVMAGAWIHLLSPAGFINKVLISFLGQSATLTVFSTAGCAWCLGISFFPVIAVIVATGLSEIDGGIVDVARLSTNRWGVFRYSILPQILPHLAASVCLVMIFVLAQYGVPSLLGINTYPVEIFAQFSAFYDDTAAVATALPLIVLVVFLIFLQRW
ncbi:MAG: iron ABC transporter permease, partial [Planctomycetes bacterium]|nr:iron ABC transporter permease [Planctomycetota bacterium]